MRTEANCEWQVADGVRISGDWSVSMRRLWMWMKKIERR